MLIRPITKEERLQSAQLFAIAFESPFDPNDLTPFAQEPVIWAAFDEESGEMMSTVYVTGYQVRFDGRCFKMGGVGDMPGGRPCSFDPNGEAPAGMPNGETPPALPDDGGTPPEKPDGSSMPEPPDGGTPPEKPNGAPGAPASGSV